MNKSLLFILVAFSFFMSNLYAQEPEKFPLSASEPAFRENLGQWDHNILFRNISNDIRVRFLKNGISYGSIRPVSIKETNTDQQHLKINGDPTEAIVWNFLFEGANTDPKITAKGENSSNANYFIDDQAFINVPDYSNINYHNLYPEIDLNYYTNSDHQLKYDFVIRPNGDIDNIKMNGYGIKSLNINRKGELEIETPWGVLLEKTPYSYQLINGVKKEVDIRFELKGDKVFGFKAYSDYDKNTPLTIDPIVLQWSTFFGGDVPKAQRNDSYVLAMGADKQRNVIGAGHYPTTLPVTPGSYDATFNGDNKDAWVAKFSADGQQLLFATYIGGNKIDQATELEVLDNGDIVIAGFTMSGNYPVTAGAFNTNMDVYGQGFVTRLNASGNKLVYSTFIGGTSRESLSAMTVDNAGNPVLLGDSWSNDFPTTPGSYKPTRPTGSIIMWAMKLSNDGSKQLFGTWLGIGSPVGIAVDKNNEVYITGHTADGTYPLTANAMDKQITKSTTCSWCAAFEDIFVTHLSANGAQLKYSTFIGAGGEEKAAAIDVDNQGNIYVAGHTRYDPFPTTPGSFMPQQPRPDYSGIIFKIGTSRNLAYSTYLSGTNGKNFSMHHLKVLKSGEVFVTGQTLDTDFPVTDCALDKTYGNFTAMDGTPDAFFSLLSADGSQLIYSSYLGGRRNDYWADIDILETDCIEEVAMTVTTHSPDFPLANAYQTAHRNDQYNGDQPAFLKLKPKVLPDFKFTTPGCQSPVQFTDLTTGDCIWRKGPWTPSSWHWDFGDGTTSTEQNPTHTYTQAGNYQVKLVVSCPTDSIIRTISISGGNLNLTGQTSSTPADCGKNNGTATATVSGGGSYTYIWNDKNKQTTATATGLAPGKYEVTISDPSSCSSKTFSVNVGSIPTGIDATASSTPATCGKSNGSATATVSGGSGNYTYQWDGPSGSGQTTATASGLTPGAYQVTIKDQQGCPAETTLTVTVENTGTLDVNIPPVTVVGCDRMGGVNAEAFAVVNTGTPPYTYQWDDPRNQTTDTATGLAAGFYTVTVTDKEGCQATASIAINDIIIINTTVDIIPCPTCNDGEVTANVTGTGTPPYTYRWNDENQQTTAKASGLKPGTYVVTVTDDKDCRNTDTVQVGDISIGMNDSEHLESMINIYPNPNNGRFNINIQSGSQPLSLKIYNTTGKIVHFERLNAGLHSIQPGNIGKGIYLVVLSNTEYRISKRVHILK